MKKNNYEGFYGWIRYIRDYKSNIENDSICEGEIVEAKRNVKRLSRKLNKEILDKTLIEHEKDNLIQLYEKRIQALGNQVSLTKKRNNELRNTIAILYKQNEDLEMHLTNTELARRKNAGAIGGLKAENNKLKQDLERANQKITWLKTNQKAPTKEEIIAYETRMKEVEKRNKRK